eukprot:1437646-Prorocentrum_lima.AAC.1
MTSSLVGSEMCIRDSTNTMGAATRRQNRRGRNTRAAKQKVQDTQPITNNALAYTKVPWQPSRNTTGIVSIKNRGESENKSATNAQ